MTKIRGFTLIELMIAVAVLALLSSIALPTYSSYVERSRLADTFNVLSTYRLRMEQGHQDNGNYGKDACAVATPAATTYFQFSCEVSDDGQTFLAKATGAGAMAAYGFTVDDQENKVTTAFPKGDVPANCWMTRVGDCK